MNIILLRQEELSDRNFSFAKTDDRFLHIKKVLKLGVGSVFKAGIIDGKKGTAEITSFSDELLTARFTVSEQADGGDDVSALPPIRLILGFPRPIQLRRILRDVAGLGIEALYLTGTELGEKSYLKADIAAETEIERLLIDGCSQAGDTHIPKVYRAYSVRHFFDRYEDDIRPDHLRAVLDVPFQIDQYSIEQNRINQGHIGQDRIEQAHSEQGDTLCVPTMYPLPQLQWDGKQTLWLAVGNERGWSLNERLLFAKKQFTAYTMGRRILRTETAVTSAVSVCLANSGAWDTRGVQ
ncbi:MULTISPECIES: RsmE family RNA methyltransferase [unclassified Treponema]|uniref:RsmE family RNA methyltransferase n=1 Tax=unclassified Treponema TaxID=2638727 RepID=UPI00068983C9|nr:MULTISPECIES: RsmE family RNA methyltransferase [unclassified Treponema]UTC50136.1 RsmE family RNA methyltransferase [Treponema sp. OMZ 855]